MSLTLQIASLIRQAKILGDAGGACDFQLRVTRKGAISARLNDQQAPAYDVAQKDDVNQYVLTVVRRVNPDIAKQQLAHTVLTLQQHHTWSPNYGS